MDSERINRWLTLGANIGVLIGLLLLVIEIRQSNLLALAQIEQSRSDSLLQWRRQWVTDDAIAEMLLARRSFFTMQEYHALDVVDRQAAIESLLSELDPLMSIRMRSFIHTSFWDFENVYAQYKRGLISEEYWNERVVGGILQDAPAWKAAGGGRFPQGRQDFIDEVEMLLEMYPGAMPQ